MQLIKPVSYFVQKYYWPSIMHLWGSTQQGIFYLIVHATMKYVFRCKIIFMHLYSQLHPCIAEFKILCLGLEPECIPRKEKTRAGQAMWYKMHNQRTSIKAASEMHEDLGWISLRRMRASQSTVNPVLHDHRWPSKYARLDISFPGFYSYQTGSAKFYRGN